MFFICVYSKEMESSLLVYYSEVTLNRIFCCVVYGTDPTLIIRRYVLKRQLYIVISLYSTIAMSIPHGIQCKYRLHLSVYDCEGRIFT